MTTGPSGDVALLRSEALMLNANAAVKEAILEGEILNEYQSAYDFVLKRAAKMGLEKV